MFYVLLLGIIIFCSGCPAVDQCGKGPPYCINMLSVYPRTNPLKYDFHTNTILFENGELLKSQFHNFDSWSSYMLNYICGSDSFSDILFYNNEMIYRNYDQDIPDLVNDSCIIIITPDKCCKLDYQFNLISEFGNVGTETERLTDAISAAANYLGQTFVIDSGDSSVKVYDYDGAFISRWTDIGLPSRIKIFDHEVYVLDKSDDSIKKYNQDGQFISTALNSSYLNDIVAFDLEKTNEFIVADNNGKRIVMIESSGEIIDERTEYCFMDVTFTFEKVTAVQGDVFYFHIIDAEAQYILEFGEILMAKAEN